jgi:hypothetical protein
MCAVRMISKEQYVCNQDDSEQQNVYNQDDFLTTKCVQS